MSIRTALRWSALLAPCLYGACTGCGSVNYTVSSPTNEAALHRTFTQSETSMVRVDQPADRPPREPAARYLVGYNDTTDVVSPTADFECWRFFRRATLDGCASSEEFGGNWRRHDQLAVTPDIEEKGVHARHGDPPRLMTCKSHRRRMRWSDLVIVRISTRTPSPNNVLSVG